jgi:uncharacterized Tic20 family protein
MAYTEIIKFLGSLVRWVVHGLNGKFVDYNDEKFDRENFIAGIIVTIFIASILIPLIGYFSRLNQITTHLHFVILLENGSTLSRLAARSLCN